MIMGFLISMKNWGLLTTFLLIFLGLCYWFKLDSKKTSILIGQITINACLHKLHSREDTKLPTINLWVWILMCESDKNHWKRGYLIWRFKLDVLLQMNCSHWMLSVQPNYCWKCNTANSCSEHSINTLYMQSKVSIIIKRICIHYH